MAPPEEQGPNAEQVRYWNEQAGPKWVELQALIDLQIAPLGRAAMERAALVAGERVLDVGCGCGETSLELGRRVGPTGSVLGVDISRVMLERARARAAGMAHVRFEEADAQTHAFAPASVDLLFSRFGVMFFVDPRAAFANLRRALEPDGRLAFVCWRAIPENPWMMVPMAAALQHVPPPAILAPDAPGPFAFADDARVRAILEGAGFGAVGFERLDEVLTVGGGADLDRTVSFLLQMGPTAAALRDAEPALVRTVAASVREVLVPFATPEGVRMPSGSWIVTASAGSQR